MPSGGSADYKLNFYAFKESMTQLEVVFRNEQTQEYVVHEVAIKSTAAGVIDTIPLSTTVRQAVSYTLKLENPLATAVNVTMSCLAGDGSAKTPCTEVHGPSSFKLPAKSKGVEYSLEFLPTRVGDSTARLLLNSHELGLFQYELRLTGVAAAPQPVEAFRAALGESLTKRVKLVNFCSVRCEYSITIDGGNTTNNNTNNNNNSNASSGGAFTAPATLATTAAPKSGSEFSFDVTFEPSSLGDFKATLVVASPVGGEYMVPLTGHCAAPKPAGPFSVKSGSRLSVPFKNVFRTQETFTCVVDNPAFTIKAAETVKAKDSKDFVVRFDGDSVQAGKLTISCSSTPGLQWIVYLRGEPA